MTEQEEKLSSIDYLLDIISDLLGDKSIHDSIIFNQICLNANAKHEKELDEAYKNGYDDAVLMFRNL